MLVNVQFDARLDSSPVLWRLFPSRRTDGMGKKIEFSWQFAETKLCTCARVPWISRVVITELLNTWLILNA